MAKSGSKDRRRRPTSRRCPDDVLPPPPIDAPNALHLPTGQFSYIGRSHHVERRSLREVLPYFGLEESPYTKQLIDYWDEQGSDLYLVAVRAVAGWLDFLPALSTRVILDRSPSTASGGVDAVSLQHHAYFEASMTLGDSIAAGIAGHPRAAFALVRPFVELATAEVWVNEPDGEERLHNFLAYLRGSGHRPRHAEMLNAIFAEERFKALASLRRQLESIYGASSASIHLRSAEDGALDMRDGNRIRATFPEVTLWLTFLGVATHRMLAMLTLRYPMVLFPLDVERKFGFLGPVGVVVDEATSQSVTEGLGSRHADALRTFLARDSQVEGTLAWFEGQPTLTDEEIETSWREYATSEPKRPHLKDVEPFARGAMLRASMGGLMWALDRFAATRDIPELPDFDPEKAFARELLATELAADYPPVKARAASDDE